MNNTPINQLEQYGNINAPVRKKIKAYSKNNKSILQKTLEIIQDNYKY